MALSETDNSFSSGPFCFEKVLRVRLDLPIMCARGSPSMCRAGSLSHPSSLTGNSQHRILTANSQFDTFQFGACHCYQIVTFAGIDFAARIRYAFGPRKPLRIRYLFGPRFGIDMNTD